MHVETMQSIIGLGYDHLSALHVFVLIMQFSRFLLVALDYIAINGSSF